MNYFISLTIKEVQMIVNPGGGEQGEGKDRVYMWRPRWSGLVLCKLCVLLMGCGTAANRSDTSLHTAVSIPAWFQEPGGGTRKLPLQKHWYLPFRVRRNRSKTRAGSPECLIQKQKLSAGLIFVPWFLLGRDLVSINSWDISSLTHSIHLFHWFCCVMWLKLPLFCPLCVSQ